MRKSGLFLVTTALASIIGALIFDAPARAQRRGTRRSQVREKTGSIYRPSQGGSPLGFQAKFAPTPKHAAVRSDAADPGDVFPVTVDPTLNLDPDTLALYEQMASILDGYSAVPNSRINYYSAFNGSPDYSIQGWQGIVESVQAVVGGNLVTLKVIPSFDSATAVESDYTEQYTVGNDGTITYAGSADPLGLAGQVPPGIFDY